MPRRWSASARRSSRRRSRSTSSTSAAASRRSIRAWSRRRWRTISTSIHRALREPADHYSAELWCEPGRALCAEYASVLVRVEKRRGDELYINDGAYGALFDAAHIGWRFPVKLVRDERVRTRSDMPFSFYGPTCDDLDHMAGPFWLPADVRPGDYIEIGMLGAYGCAMRTGFNGFGDERHGDRRRRADGDRSTPTHRAGTQATLERRHAVRLTVTASSGVPRGCAEHGWHASPRPRLRRGTD